MQAYMGVKYATAERFRAPRLLEVPGGATVEARTRPPACLQGSGQGLRGSEDCLYLSVYAPPGTSARSKKAVIVFIHGGNLIGGAQPGAAKVRPLVTEGDVLVVAVNYRLNVFGFFSGPEWGISNFGIRDLVAALQWVQKNIEGFGGDPARVTISGQSAGARAVMVLYQSPAARGLFHRGIAHSPGLLIADFTQHDRKAAGSMGRRCLEATACRSTACLRRLSAADLARACHFYMAAGEFLPFEGVHLAGYDGDVVKYPVMAPFCSTVEAANSDKPLMVGSLLHEWRLFQRFFPPLNATAMVRRFLREYLPSYAHGSSRLQSCARSKILGMYADATCNASVVSECARLGAPDILQLATDVYSMGLFAGMGAGSGKRYRFLLDVEAQRGTLGSAHAIDTCYLFEEKPGEAGGFCGDGSRAAQQERLGRALRQYWTSFAKTGAPASALGPRWLPVASEGEDRAAGLPFLNMKLGGPTAMSGVQYSSAAAFAVLSGILCGRTDVARNASGCLIHRRGVI